MNLLLLAVWSVLLSCTVSLPRRRHIKYPVTKFQNSYCERSHPTALEVLERTLLHPSDRGRERSHSHSGRKRSVHHQPDICEDSTSPLYPDLLGDIPDRKDDLKINSCVSSFGNESPLCKPRKRRKKSFFGISEIHKRPFRSETGANKNMSDTTSNSGDDFFGLFKFTAPEYQTNTPLKMNENFNYTIYSLSTIVTSNATPLNTNSEFTLQSSSREATSLTQTETSPENKYESSVSNEYVKASSANTNDAAQAQTSKDEASKIILPGSVQKIGSESQLIFLGQDDGPKKGDLKNDLNTTQLIEAEDDAASVDENAISEESSEEPEGKTGLTLPPLKTSLLTGMSYTKKACESETKKSCICSFSSVDSDFQTIFNKARTEEEIMIQVSNMRCRRYSVVASIFDLNTNAKPRVLKGKTAPFAVDNRHGAKEVTEKSLDEFIIYSALDDGITRVFVSAHVKIPCFPKPDIHLSSTDADHVTYTWTFGNRKQSITEGRITEDSGDGTLTIQNIQLTDSQNYTCEIDYIHPDTGERTTDSFVHRLSVVTLPTVSARAMVHFKSDAACDESLLEMFEMYLPQQVEKVICSPGNDRPQLCSVVIHSPVCHSDTQETTPENSKREALEEPLDSDREKREATMEMSLNYEVFIHRPAAKELPGAKARLCDPDCHLLINFKLLQFFKETMKEVALIPIISKVQGGGRFTPVPSSVKVKYIFGCIGGYFLENGFCLACPMGTYSDDGATECQKCPVHSYSGSVGTRKCTPCKHMWMPICNESFEALNVRMIVYVVGGVSLLLGCFIIYYMFWYKGQTCRELFKKGPKEAKSERVRSKKEAKLRKEFEKKAKAEAKLKQKEQMEPLLYTSGESEPESEPELKTKRHTKVEIK